MAVNNSSSVDLGLTASKGMQEELAGQAVTFLRKDVGYG
jgi:hypothetical protein